MIYPIVASAVPIVVKDCTYSADIKSISSTSSYYIYLVLVASSEVIVWDEELLHHIT